MVALLWESCPGSSVGHERGSAVMVTTPDVGRSELVRTAGDRRMTLPPATGALLRNGAGYPVVMRTVSDVPDARVTVMRTPVSGTLTPTPGISGYQYRRLSSKVGWAACPRM